MYFVTRLEIQTRRSCHPEQDLLINLINNLWYFLVASFISFASCGLARCCLRSPSFNKMRQQVFVELTIRRQQVDYGSSIWDVPILQENLYQRR